jgi:hypothetical protein
MCDRGVWASRGLNSLIYWSGKKRLEDHTGLRCTKNSKLHGRDPPSLGKRGPEHRQTASRLGFGRFILQNVPVFREHAVGHPDDIGGDPISRHSSFRKPTMDDHVIVFSNDQARLVLQRRPQNRVRAGSIPASLAICTLPFIGMRGLDSRRLPDLGDAFRPPPPELTKATIARSISRSAHRQTFTQA